MICTLHQMSSRWWNQEKWEGWGTYGRQKSCRQFLVENLADRDHLENLVLCGRTTLKWIFRLIQII